MQLQKAVLETAQLEGLFATPGLLVEPAVISLEDYLNRAAEKIASDQPLAALSDLKVVLQENPVHERLYTLVEQAFTQLDDLIDARPDTAESYVQRAKGYNLIEQYEEALADWNKALSLRPDDPFLLAGRGRTRMGASKFREALADFSRTLQLKPEMIDLMVDAALVHYELLEVEEAMHMLDRALELAPENLEYLLTRARIQAELTWYESALEDLDRAVELDPQQLDVRLFRGRVLLESGRYQEAEIELRLVHEHSAEPLATYLLGMALAQSAHFAAAEKLLAPISDLQKFPEAYCAFGYVIGCKGNLKLGLRYLEEFERTYHVAYFPLYFLFLARLSVKNNLARARKAYEAFLGLVSHGYLHEVAKEELGAL